MDRVRDYLIQKTVHTGSDFTIYEATREDGALFFVKLPSQRYPDLRLLKQLEHEFTIGEVLDPAWALHPVELVRLPDNMALVLEHFAGQPLISLQFPHSILDFLNVAVAIVSSLSSAHEAGLVHRDLKPENVLVKDSSCVRLTGFGIATRLTPHALPVQPGLLEGTLAYMAPEQTGQLNRGVHEFTDLYALGIIFYEILTGKIPFEGHDALEWVHLIVARIPPSPRERRADALEAIARIILKLLAKLPEERYQTATGLELDLVRCRDEWQRTGEIQPFPLADRDVCGRLLIPQMLYGREPDAESLLASYRQVASTGSPAVTLVSGYAGIGKTALVAELRQPVTSDKGFFLAGKFEQYVRDTPYLTLIQAFNSLIQHVLRGSEALIDAWREAIQGALGKTGRIILDMIPQAKLIIGPQPPLPELPLSEAEQRVRVAFRNFINAFCTREHPLVLFLDDLQWADSASLRLLVDLATNPTAHYFQVIGAYRDNEVSPSHPAILAIEDIRRAGIPVVDIVLGPLKLDDINRLVADTLHREYQEAWPLSQLIFHKTGGNPFFMTQFLTTLYTEGLLACDRGRSLWHWDLEKIEAKHYTDNVIDFLVQKMARLVTESSRIMQLAACIGVVSEASFLSAVAKVPLVGIEQHLAVPLQEGMMVQEDATYRFVHDRVQQAAYSMVPEEERKAVHLLVGRRLLRDSPADALDENIFEIVSHLNRASSLILDPNEQTQVAELNLRAGKRAKTSAAYRSGIQWLAAGLQMLGDRQWLELSNLSFSLMFEQAQCAWLAGEVEEADGILESLFAHAETREQKTEVLRVRSEVAMTMADPPGAAAHSLTSLALFEIHWTQHPDDMQVQHEYEAVWTNLGARPIEDLINLPEMTDPAMITVMTILSAVYLPAYWIDMNLQLLVTCRMVNLSLQYGNTNASTMGFAGLGRLLGPKFNRYRDGYRFGQLGYTLVEKRNLLEYKARIADLFGLSTSFWVAPLREGLEYARTSFRAAGEVGDLTYGCYACMHIVTFRLIMGHPLQDVLQESEALLAFVRAAGYDEVADIIVGMQRFIRKLGVETTKATVPTETEFDEAAFEERIRTERSALTADWYYIMKMQGRYVMGDYPAALEALEYLDSFVSGFMTQLNFSQYVYYGALSLTAYYDHLDHTQQVECLEKVRALRDRLQTWTVQGPENFRHLYALVSAEIARLEGRRDDALKSYDEAIEAARAGGFIQNEAIAAECAARFHLILGNEDRARHYLYNSRYMYARWGAKRKVGQLEDRFSALFLQEGATSSTATIELLAEQLDVLAVVKATQAISQEIVFSDLVNKLMQIVMEHSGAYRTVLLLMREAGLEVIAEATVNRGEIETNQWPESCTSCQVPESIINYVRHTQEKLHLDDAALSPHFSGDPYISRTRPSLACLPITRQRKLIGLLYLESSVAAKPFTNEKIRFLELLAMQSAISIDNARLYHELQQENSVRKRAEESLAQKVDELARANRDLEQVAYISAHDLQEPLRMVTSYLQLLVTRYRDVLEEKGKRYVDYAVEGATRMQKQVDGLLLYSTIPQGAEFKPVDMNRIASIATVNLATVILETGGSVTYTDLPTVWGDERQLLMLLESLVSNGLKFRIPGIPPLVQISGERREKESIFSVKDNGIGIEDEFYERIFLIFKRLHKREKYPGIGIGLALSKRIIERHHGRIWVESVSGEGSTFFFTLRNLEEGQR